MKQIHATIPKGIHDKIERLSSKQVFKEKAYKLIASIQLKFYQTRSHSSSFIEIPSSYLKAVAGRKYAEVMSWLKDSDIVEVYGRESSGKKIEIYDTTAGKCKSYRLSPKLITFDTVNITLKNKRVSSEIENLIINKRRFKKSIFIDDFRSLNYDYSQLEIEKQKIISSIDYSGLLTDHYITSSRFEVNNHTTNKKYWTSLDKALDYCKRNATTLIKDLKHSKYYIDDLDRYLIRKNHFIEWYYNSILSKIKHKTFSLSRNHTNRRLDHLFTQMPKVFLSEIINQNDLVEIDLCNSQFAFLSYILKSKKSISKNSDFKRFYEQCAIGNLYSYLQLHLNLSNREAAKQIMMETAFSSPRFSSPEKRVFQKIFPSVFHYIESYKTSYSKRSASKHGCFAIMLQRAESEMFIDKIFYQLRLQEKKFLITKHDSLIVKKSDEICIRNYLKDFFNSTGFECTLK